MYAASRIRGVAARASRRQVLSGRRALSSAPEVAQAAAAAQPSVLSSLSARAAAVQENLTTLAAAPIEGTVPDFRTPIYMIQQTLDMVHNDMGLPWWVTIAGSTLVVKSLLFPIFVKQQQSIARNSWARPELEKLQEDHKHKQAVTGGANPQAAAEFKNRLTAIYTKHNCHPLGALGWGMLQAPAFITFFLSLRSLHQRFEGLETGGMLWFQDLAMPDSSYLLPVLSGSAMLLNMEVHGREMGPMKTKLQEGFRWFGRVMCFMVVPFSGYLPATVMIYWVCNSTITLGQTLAFKVRPIRNVFGVPDKLLPSDSPAGRAAAARGESNTTDAAEAAASAEPVKEVKPVVIPKTVQANKPPRK